MIKNVLQDIGGVGIYGVISICLFFLVFSGVLIWACLINKQTADALSALPLEDEPRPANPHPVQPRSNPTPSTR